MKNILLVVTVLYHLNHGESIWSNKRLILRQLARLLFKVNGISLPSQKISHRALDWFLFDSMRIAPACTQNKNNLILNTRFANIHYNK